MRAIQKKKRTDKSKDFGTVTLHHDNAPAHTAASRYLEINVQGSDALDQRLYRPDLASMDFAIFPPIRSQLKGVTFEDSGELKYATRTIVSGIDSSLYYNVFDFGAKEM